MKTIDNIISVSSLVPPTFAGRDFTSSDYRDIIDDLLRVTDRRFRYGLRHEGTYSFAEFFAVPDATCEMERSILLQGAVSVLYDTDNELWRGIVHLDSWECRERPVAPVVYRDERFFFLWPEAVCDFDPSRLDGGEAYFDDID